MKRTEAQTIGQIVDIKMALVAVANDLGSTVFAGNNDKAAALDVEHVVVYCTLHGTRLLGMGQFQVSHCGSAEGARHDSSLLFDEVVGSSACCIGINVACAGIER